MKKAIRILTPIALALAILICSFWYLFVYDRDFTRDMLLSCARFSEAQNNHTMGTWFYNLAYAHSGNSDAVACELAAQYKASGNYTKAEYTLKNAIADGGGIDLYIALSKVFLEQDKVLDAVDMLNKVTNPEVKMELAAARPATPIIAPEPGSYSKYISATVTATEGTLYVNTDGEYPSLKTDAYTDAIPLVDGKNIICAVAVGENGLVSTLAKHEYEIGGVVKLMEFADPVLEAEIRSMLNVSDTAKLFTNDLWEITEFTAPEGVKSYEDLQYMAFLNTLTIEGGNVTDFGFIPYLKNLTELNISNVSVSQEALTDIASLPSLTVLRLENCGLSTIAPLKNATGLTLLDLNNNTIRNLEPISVMTELTELNLQHNAVTTLTELVGNSKLTKLDVSYNSITTLTPISSLIKLTWLDAGSNSITELGQLSRLTGLTYLSVSSNQLTNIDIIADCLNLQDLNISSNSIEDIQRLSALNKLMYFDFSHNVVEVLPTFSTDSALVRITGSHNKLSSLKELSGLKQLNSIYMDYNEEITSVEELATCPVLIEVNVFATKVTEVRALTNLSIVVNYNPVQDKKS